MSYHTFFMFSEGLAKTIKVPAGTKKEIADHVEWIESTLNIKREKYLDNPEHWEHNNYSDIKDDILCESARKHNTWVRYMYAIFEKWSKSPAPTNTEEITPKYAKSFWPALQLIIVSPERWTAQYYNDRMDTIYEVMRGRETEGISFDEKPLTAKQAGNVIQLFAEFLDEHDIRLDVPKGCDQLFASYNGGYEWCQNCGAIRFEDAKICNKRKCPLRKELQDQ